MRGSHARTLLPLIDEVLAAGGVALRALDLLAVSIGPGSFTGLRIGLSVAKGLALATGLPVVGVPTLAAYADTAGPRPGLVCPVLDARKGEVYAAAFHWPEEPDRRRRGQAAALVASTAPTSRRCWSSMAECIVAPVAVTPAQCASVRAPCTLFGDGVDAYAGLWRRALGEGGEADSTRGLAPEWGGRGSTRERACGGVRRR